MYGKPLPHRGELRKEKEQREKELGESVRHKIKKIRHVLYSLVGLMGQVPSIPGYVYHWAKRWGNPKLDQFFMHLNDVPE